MYQGSFFFALAKVSLTSGLNSYRFLEQILTDILNLYPKSVQVKSTRFALGLNVLKLSASAVIHKLPLLRRSTYLFHPNSLFCLSLILIFSVRNVSLEMYIHHPDQLLDVKKRPGVYNQLRTTKQFQVSYEETLLTRRELPDGTMSCSESSLDVCLKHEGNQRYCHPG